MNTGCIGFVGRNLQSRHGGRQRRRWQLHFSALRVSSLDCDKSVGRFTSLRPFDRLFLHYRTTRAGPEGPMPRGSARTRL